MRVAATTARRVVTVRSTTASSSHSNGAGATIARAVAFTEPVVAITSAHSAASRHRVRVAAPIVRPSTQPRPAHGSSIDDVRDTYGTRYGDSWYTSPAVTAAASPKPSRRRTAQAIPVPAANMIVAIHRRWATQSGRPIACAATYHGPDGHR